MTNKIYVVLSRDYEYNDEYYVARDGGNKVFATGDYEVALKKVYELTVEGMKEGSFSEWLGEEYQADYDEEALSEIMEKLYGKTDDEINYPDLGDYYSMEEFSEKLKNLTTDELYTVIENFHLKDEPYFIQVVDYAE